MQTNGRIICDELKRVRMELAKANGINYQPTVCNHQGECTGTCPKCEAELAELTRQIKAKKDAKVVGMAPLKIVAMAATAVALSLASCQSEDGDVGEPDWANDSTNVHVNPADTVPGVK